jgi:1-phosphofructokinase
MAAESRDTGGRVIITVTPNPSIDWTFDVESLTRGQLHRARAAHAEASGKGVNVARALAANGLAATAVLPLGGLGGAELAALLTADGVGFAAVPVSGAVRVNVSLAEPGGVATKVNAPGPELPPAEAAELIARALRDAAPGDWVVGSGSLPPGADPGFYAALGAGAHERGARFALDSSGAALAAGLAARPDVIKPNTDELAEVTGAVLETLGDAADAAGQLVAGGVACVLVSAGPDGALLVTAAGSWHAAAAVPALASTVGAGDALLAGFVASAQGHPARVAAPGQASTTALAEARATAPGEPRTAALGEARTAALGEAPAALAEATAWASAALGVPGSRVPAVTDAHRGMVALSATMDRARPLRHPAGRRGAGR